MKRLALYGSLILFLIISHTSFGMWATLRRGAQGTTQRVVKTTQESVIRPTTTIKPTIVERARAAWYNLWYGRPTQTATAMYSRPTSKPGQPYIQKSYVHTSAAPQAESGVTSVWKTLTNMFGGKPASEGQVIRLQSADLLRNDLIALMGKTKYWVSPRGIEFQLKDFNNTDFEQEKTLIDQNSQLINALVQPAKSYDFYWDSKTNREIEGISQNVKQCTIADLIVSDILDYLSTHNNSEELMVPESMMNELELLKYTKDAGGSFNQQRQSLYINGMQKLVNAISNIVKNKGVYAYENKKKALIEAFDKLYPLLLEYMPDLSDQLKELKWNKERIVWIAEKVQSTFSTTDEARTVLILKLNLPHDASDNDIKKAYWEYNALHHPEAKNQNKDSYEEFGRINQAFGHLVRALGLYEKERVQ